MTPTESDDAAEERYVEGPEFCSRTTTRDDGTLECTIYPTDVPAEDRPTRWITAEEGSYVGLGGMR
jgi:hypothetical protein